MRTGRGKDARVGPLAQRSTLRGMRVIVRSSPAAAVAVAVGALREQGFDVGGEELQRRLTATGSEWVAQDLQIGDRSPSLSKRARELLSEVTLLELLPVFWRGVAPTLVVASARHHPGGAELVVFSHTSTKGLRAGVSDAGPLIQHAYDELVRHCTAAGELVSHERLRSLPNDGGPASQAAVRELLGWR